MKIATFNIRNIFHRHIDLVDGNRETKSGFWKDELERLLTSDPKSEKQIARMRELVALLGFHNEAHKSDLFMKNMEDGIYMGPTDHRADVKAARRTRWNGWTKLRSVPIGPTAIANKTKVIMDSDPDILLLQEVEDRSSLRKFNETFLDPGPLGGYTEIYHTEGNGGRGRGMGLLLKDGHTLKSMKSFANLKHKDGGFLFDTDCVLYHISLSDGTDLHAFNCNFTIGKGPKAQNDIKRKHMARTVARLYGGLLSKGFRDIVIAGTLDAPSYSGSISDLLTGTDLKDVARHRSFEVETDSGSDGTYHRLGAYRMGVNIKQKDYLLLSPDLFDAVKSSGMDRKAVWPLTVPQWNTYDTMENEKDAASDHPLLWGRT